ncbi:MAG: TIGR04255 family protein [Terriglobia bacterium]
MKHKELKNKPLIEAQVEIHWGQGELGADGIKTDPYYKMTLGRFYERVMNTYPVHEILPAAKFPETMVYHTAQHLFRVGHEKWPALQIGPGILSIHTRQEYLWEDLAAKAQDALEQLLDAYPKMAELRIEALRLHYIDAVHLDFTRENVLQFLRDKFKTHIELPPSLFFDGHVNSRPKSFSWEASFEEDQPEGTITVRFSTGERDARPALLWETIVESSSRQLPPLPSGMGNWLSQAHALTEDWFFKFIEGDLEKDFAGD